MRTAKQASLASKEAKNRNERDRVIRESDARRREASQLRNKLKKAKPLLPKFMRKMEREISDKIRAGESSATLCLTYPPDGVISLLVAALRKRGYETKTSTFSDNEGPDLFSVECSWGHE